jgi:diguanylate cyclase (GGDEF)-like protein
MNRKSVALICQDLALSIIIERILKQKYTVTGFSNMKPVFDYIYNTIPNLIVFDTRLDDPVALEMLTNLKGDPIFNHLPVLAIISDGSPLPRWDTLPFEDYLRRSATPEEIAARVELSILKCERVIEVNPLTSLPGSISVNRTIQGLLDEHRSFSVGYADLDNFKPFNDYYGFDRGDEVIKMTGRVILNIAKSKQPIGSFVGHIGGDDFVFIMDPDLVEETSMEILGAFDRIIPTFYDREDWNRGYIESTDRRGTREMFPPVTLSIGITNSNQRQFLHYGQIIQAVSEMKKYAKHFEGSCYRSDKRYGPEQT